MKNQNQALIIKMENEDLYNRNRLKSQNNEIQKLKDEIENLKNDLKTKNEKVSNAEIEIRKLKISNSSSTKELETYQELLYMNKSESVKDFNAEVDVNDVIQSNDTIKE